ncbi:MAG: ComEC/Rec2 family competence protein, partial [Rhodospirillales bacterium]
AYGQGEVTHRPVEPGWRAGLQALRQDLTGRIMAGLPGETGTIAAALMTGERRAIPGETLDAIRDSGLAHLLAISGLHIGLVTALLFGGLRLLFCLSPGLAERWPAKKLAAALALPGALAYALIAGATVPSLRAFLMVAVVLTAVLLDRRGISMRNVAIAAFLLLLAMPESLLGPSFQMSFAAVTALVAAYEVLQAKGWWPTGQRVQQRGQGGWLRRAGTYLAGVAISTLIAGLATAPFAAFHFNRVADFSLLANLAAVPVTALWTMPSALAAFILMPLGWEGPALAVMGAGIEVMTAIARWVADLPGAVTLVPAMPGWSLVLLTAGSFWLLAARGVARSLGPVTIAASLALALATPKPDLLIDAKGRLIGLNDGLGFQVSSLSTARFERDVWLGRLATAEAGKFPRDGANGGLRCDIAACRWVTPYGTSVALIRHPAALAEDCRSARLVISLERVPTDCRRLTRVIDKGDIRAKGATAVYLRWDGSIRIETDRERRGDRPWVALPAPHQPRSTAW